MMRLTTKSLTPEQKNAIIMACEALAGFRISYEDRFFHVNRDNTFATENTLHALSVVIHAFDAQKLQQIKDNPELKEIFRQSFKTLVDMLSELEARNVRAKYSDIAPQMQNTMLFGYNPQDMTNFESYAQQYQSNILMKFRFLLPMSDGSDAFANGTVPQALSQQAVAPLINQLKRMLEIAFPSAKRQTRDHALAFPRVTQLPVLDLPGSLEAFDPMLEEPPMRRTRRHVL